MERNPVTAESKKRVMKSLLISSTCFPPEMGGISHLMSGIASALGPDRVCCLTGQRANGATKDVGSKVYRRPVVFYGKGKYLRAAAWGAAIAEIIVRERPKIIQAASAGEGPLGLWLRHWLRLPYVVYAHGNEVLNAMQPGGQKLQVALQRADRVLAVSHFTANLVQKAGVSSDRIEIVHPGCNSEHFRPLAPRMDLRQKLLGDRYKDQVILTVGNLVPRKGHDMVIRALPRLRTTVSDVKYIIIGEAFGEDPYRNQLENLAIGLGVRDCVIFAGNVSAEDLPDIYALADVFVMASREQLDACDVEGFGMVFLEASACAKPVVGGRSGGIPDAIVDGITGLLVNPHDPEDIANALARLLSNSDLATRFGQEGRSWVVKYFGWDRVADQVQGILQSILQESSHRELSHSTYSVAHNQIARKAQRLDPR
jgi:phosphatidyl-myo-inositol dimannoside synthase